MVEIAVAARRSTAQISSSLSLGCAAIWLDSSLTRSTYEYSAPIGAQPRHGLVVPACQVALRRVQLPGIGGKGKLPCHSMLPSPRAGNCICCVAGRRGSRPRPA